MIEYKVSFDNAEDYKLELPEYDDYGPVLQVLVYNGISVHDTVCYIEDSTYSGEVAYFFDNTLNPHYGICVRYKASGFDPISTLKKISNDYNGHDGFETGI